MKKIIIIACFLFFVAGCSKLFVPSAGQVCFRDDCYNVEIAQTDEERQRGLQARTSMRNNHGMLFIFDQSKRYSFWMKETLIPLDMIWMDDARRIVYIAQEVPPCAGDPCPIYRPDDEAMYVLEIKAGQVKKLNLKRGDQAVFKLKDS